MLPSHVRVAVRWYAHEAAEVYCRVGLENLDISTHLWPMSMARTVLNGVRRVARPAGRGAGPVQVVFMQPDGRGSQGL